MGFEDQSAGKGGLLVLADDLTGANDVGAQFAKRGISSIVRVEPEARRLPEGYEVVVVNTESRHVAPEVAAGRVRRIAGLGLQNGIRHFFKKTDSTLRGNIGAELKALLKTTGEKTIPFVPAFPETGRTTRNGVHYVHGVPIGETEFSRDPLSPVPANEVVEVLRLGSDLPAHSLKLSADVDFPAGCVVFDCESRNEMRGIAACLAGMKRLKVLAGSAAFAEELAGVLSLERKPLVPLKAHSPALLVNGSLNPRSLEQIAAADGYKRIRMDAGVLIGLSDMGGVLEEIRSVKGVNVILYSAERREDAAALIRSAAGLGYQSREAHMRVAQNTGRIVREAVEQGGFRTLVVFGGDTLLGIARACGWNALLPRAEIASGITVSTPEGSDLAVITKAGGFGTQNIVASISQWIEERSKAGA